MDYEKITAEGSDSLVLGVRSFDLAAIAASGQCFRWTMTGEHTACGIVSGRRCVLTQQGDTLRFHNIPPEETKRFWLPYFDFDRDYDALKAELGSDPVMCRAVEFVPGMRVLRQEPWETLCSFILSANNNIPRIMGIIERLCALLGEPLKGGGYAFPTPEAMANCAPEDLAPLRAGYRAPYLIDAAKKVAGGELVLDALYTMPLPEARKALMQVKGVGPKVAECVLLYGFSRAECIPVDVWVKRAFAVLYPQGFPSALAAVGGLAQQYLFHYVRCCPEALDAASNDR